MNDQRFYSLIELKAAVNDACKEALNDGEDHCRVTHEWRNERGERGYVAYLDGVRETDDAFYHIYQGVKARGFLDIDLVGDG